MKLQGKNLVGGNWSGDGGTHFHAYLPKTAAEDQAVSFTEADSKLIGEAARLATEAAPVLAALPGRSIGAFLEAIATELTNLGDSLVEQADRESALGLDRLRGERDRTVNQLRLFARIAADGSWMQATIDRPLPDRKPLPRPDLRRLLSPLGPVAVFGASNFPLAFSVAGGDTASAFAARNPVIVKAHPAHPGTSEMVGAAIGSAVKASSLPPGTFSLLHGTNPQVSLSLVTNPAVQAVAFTGSSRAGRALYDAGTSRPQPIPVFCEMGSVNPVFYLEGALTKDPAAAAAGLFRSVTLGVGQFCTCPGLAFALEGPEYGEFVSHLAREFSSATPATMLNRGIADSYANSIAKASSLSAVSSHFAGQDANPAATEGRPGLIVTSSKTWLEHKPLHSEIFGPSTVLVKCSDHAEMLQCARALEGNLTATVHGSEAELTSASDLVGLLTTKAGRLIFNGYPTGVEVSHAMQHGGPYGATTDARFTSVGAAAIYRFARPVCYQNFPQALLPPELQDANPLNIWRTVDGELTKDAL